MEQQVRPLDLLVREIKAAMDQADKAQTRADDLKITAGRLLLEAKVQLPHGKWQVFLQENGFDKRRSSEMIKIAQGKITPEQLRIEANERKQTSRQRIKQETPRAAVLSSATTSDTKRSVAVAVVSTNALVTELVKPVIVTEEKKSEEPKPYDWSSDERTKKLQSDLDMAKINLNQANRKIDSLREELDDLKYDTAKQKAMLRLLREADPEAYDELENETMKQMKKSKI